MIEASWYGSDSPSVPLGADFHARRLSIIASQVGEVAAGHRTRRTRAQRMSAALAALNDDRFDSLITGISGWRELPTVMDELSGSDRDGSGPARSALCHVIDYTGAHTR